MTSIRRTASLFATKDINYIFSSSMSFSILDSGTVPKRKNVSALLNYQTLPSQPNINQLRYRQPSLRPFIKTIGLILTISFHRRNTAHTAITLTSCFFGTGTITPTTFAVGTPTYSSLSSEDAMAAFLRLMSALWLAYHLSGIQLTGGCGVASAARAAGAMSTANAMKTFI